MAKSWQKMKKILVQLSFNLFWGTDSGYPKNQISDTSSATNEYGIAQCTVPL